MTIESFVENFSGLFFDTNTSLFSTETIFRDIDEWGSMIGLSVIAMVDEEYTVKLTGDDIRNSKTIGDIFEIVKARV